MAIIPRHKKIIIYTQGEKIKKVWGALKIIVEYSQIFDKLILSKGLYRTKRGRKPKLTDTQSCVLYIASTILAIPIILFIKALGLKVHSWRIFRSYRTKRIYRY